MKIKTILQSAAFMLLCAIIIIGCGGDWGDPETEGLMTISNLPEGWSFSVEINSQATFGWETDDDGLYKKPDYDTWYENKIGGNGQSHPTDNTVEIWAFNYKKQNGVWLPDRDNGWNESFEYTGKASVFIRVSKGYFSFEKGLDNVDFNKGKATINFASLGVTGPVIEDPTPSWHTNAAALGKINITAADKLVTVNVTDTGGGGYITYSIPSSWSSFTKIRIEFEVNVTTGEDAKFTLKSGFASYEGDIANPNVPNSQYLDLTNDDTFIEINTAWFSHTHMGSSGITFQINNHSEKDRTFTFKVTRIIFII